MKNAYEYGVLFIQVTGDGFMTAFSTAQKTAELNKYFHQNEVHLKKKP